MAYYIKLSGMITESQKWYALFGVWLLYACFGLVVTSLAPLAPEIIRDLNMSHGEMGLALGAWQLVYVFAALPLGMLVDRIGARRSLALGGLLIALSAVARASASDSFSLILAVMLFGLGGPIISGGAPKVVTSLFTGSARGLAMGIYITGPAFGGIVSLAATNSILLPLFDNNWRTVLILWGAIGLGCSCTWLMLSRCLETSAVGRQSDHHGSQVQALSVLASNPIAVIILLMSISVFMFNHGLNNWLPTLLESKGMTPELAGYWAAIPIAIGIVGSLIIPRLAVPSRRFHILLALSVAALLASLLLRVSGGWPLILGLLLQGIAKSSLMTVLILSLVELPGIGERYAGISAGVFFTAAEFGGMLGPLTLGILYSPKSGFSGGLWLLTSLSMLMVIASAILFRYRRSAVGSGALHLE